MEAIVDQVKAYAARLDESGRLALVNTLFELQSMLEPPFDALRRFGNGVGRYIKCAETMLI